MHPDTLPVELSFVDADDTVRYFSHENHTKIFPRTRGAIEEFADQVVARGPFPMRYGISSSIADPPRGNPPLELGEISRSS